MTLLVSVPIESPTGIFKKFPYPKPGYEIRVPIGAFYLLMGGNDGRQYLVTFESLWVFLVRAF